MSTPLLPEVLRERAHATPDRVAYRFLDDTGAEADHLTYAELHARAMTVAARLRAVCAPGERALLVFPPGLDFLAAYFGCLYARVIAVPVHPPRRAHVQHATGSIVRDCAPAAVLTVTGALEPLRTALTPLLPQAYWLTVDTMARAEFPAEPIEPGAVAFLQYTSGSTSAPKGVMVSHRNLAANQEMIKHAFGHDSGSTVVGWAPLFHDQGLIGNVLQPLWVGATSVLMSPAAFVRRPLLWLTAISEYRAHSSGGPNFAFDACVARAAAEPLPELDLTSWQVAFNGAEPIRPTTLARFAETFAPHGFRATSLYPCYGLAEATLLVSGSDKGRGPRTLTVDTEALGAGRYQPARPGKARTLVSSGRVLPGERVRIVDTATLRPCPAGRTGEIWVAGDHVAQGYWQRPEATEELLRARAADDPRTGWLRTGDVGLMVDGELYVVGRTKDMVIIRGRNHYPHDIEDTVQSAHPALRHGGSAAFAYPGAAGERLVVVQELRRDRLDADPAEVIGAIRAAVIREHELAVGDLVLTLPDQLAKTSSGKIMRTAARARYAAAGFEAWPHTPEQRSPTR
ncbi:fatty acyl-AMP ligase [Nocardia sp. NPDC050718]|uniref:fatty acyl-AMP ligase n=1 Tax=Nocardia sp. NPDC050718 TaxID=3155788 RepID=UPI0033DB3B91